MSDPVPGPEAAELLATRERIDALDDQILAALNERASLAQRVGAIKRTADGDFDFYRPDREAKVLARMAEANPGPLESPSVQRIFREVMSACLALERPLRVAFLGPAGTFTEAAALKHFGHAIRLASAPTVDAVFSEVETGACDYGVVPVENSIEGVVSHTLDRLLGSPLLVSGEVELRIHHFLMAKGTEIDHIERVFGHQQALAQCRGWLSARLPNAETLPVTSTAEGARQAAEYPGTGAVAGEAAAESYGLDILARNIEDNPANTTRFLCLGRRAVPSTGNDVTSLVFATGDEPGALYRALEVFTNHGLNLSRLESRPSRRGKWEYHFYADIDGHVDDAPVNAAIKELNARTSLLKHLGSYPRYSIDAA